jgi:hypothetical protein
MAVARHFGPCTALLSKSLPKTPLEAVPSSGAYVSTAGVYLLLSWLPHALFYFLLYFSSWFYLNCVTVSKWLCFIPHKLSTYFYYLFFLVCVPGITHTRFLRLRRAVRGRGGRASRSSPPRPTISDRFLLPGCVDAVLNCL